MMELVIIGHHLRQLAGDTKKVCNKVIHIIGVFGGEMNHLKIIIKK